MFNGCLHEKIKSVNCKIFCMYCGAELPIDYLVAKPRIEAQKQAEKAAEPAQTDNKPSEPEQAAEKPVKAVKAAKETKPKAQRQATGRKEGKK